jgi:sulfate adenylyltransferase
MSQELLEKKKLTDEDAIAQLQRVVVTDRQLHDLELIINKGFAPLKGFLNEEDYKNVVENHRLSDGTLWPIPIVFDISEESFSKNIFKVGKEVVLTDNFGTLIAILSIESIYRPDKKREAHKIYGTQDILHPGVKYLFEETGSVYVGGKVQAVGSYLHHDFADLRKTPEELKKELEKKSLQNVIAFQTRNPIHRAHAELMKKAAKKYDAHILIHPTVGPTKEGDIDAARRVKSYRALHTHYFPEATLAVVPIAMRMAGPREALWHAIIRRNYGATHFIVGRDHAGPGKDSLGRPFYGPYEAQEFAGKHALEAGIVIVPSQELVYVSGEETFKPIDEIKEGEKVLSISGTEFRRKLAEHQEIPSWFSFAEVVDALREKTVSKGTVIFFTGLSGAGKSTIAVRLQKKIEQELEVPVTFLDGDLVRTHLSYGLGFTREDRNRNIERIGFVASEVSRHGGIVICSAIAPYAESREKVRATALRLGRVVEVYIKTPLEVCKKRDVKGLYKKAELGLLKGMTGVDDPYEEPEAPDIVITTDEYSIEKAVETIYKTVFGSQG